MRKKETPKPKEKQERKPAGGAKPPEGLDLKKAGAIRAKRTANKKELILAQLRLGGVISKACDKAGVGRRTYYEWLEADAEFARAVEEARADFIEDVEDEAWSRAKSKSDLLLIFMLKAHKPELYRETTRQEVSGPGGEAIKHEGTIRIIIEGDTKAG